MIPPPNYMYQQPHGASNLPLNRNGYIYPRHYYPFPPINVPPMQVCYDYPPPSAVSAIRGPHQANFSKASSPISWPPRTFQINPRNQPPNTNSKQRQPTPPRYRNPSEHSYPFATPWNNWNMYQMSSHNMYANYNYSPGVVSSVPSFYPETSAGRNYQGHGTKSKHSVTVNRPHDQCKSQMPMPESNTPNKMETVVKSNKPLSTNTTNESESILESNAQISLTSIPHDTSSHSSSYKTTNSSISNKLSSASSQPAVQSNLTLTSPHTAQSPTQVQSSGAQISNSMLIPEIKTKPENIGQSSSTCQTTKPITLPTNLQLNTCTDSKLPKTLKGSTSKNEPTKTIDLSSLSTVLEDEKPIVEPNEVTDEKSRSNPDQIPPNTKISLQNENNGTKGLQVKEPAGATAKPICTSVTTTSSNTQPSKYYKGRPIQSQPRRDGNINNSYNNRKPVSGLVVSSYDPSRENFHNSHNKIPNNGQQYYVNAMSYDNGASARPYNTQTYYVHQPQNSQPMTGYSPIPRPYLPQQHVVQSPEYQQVYQQPTEFLYYPSSSQAFYTTTPVLMQPQVLAYHPPKVSCYNCGGQNHTGAECTELTMEEITSKGLYEHHYGPSMPDGRPRN